MGMIRNRPEASNEQLPSEPLVERRDVAQAAPASSPTKTPMFEAIHAGRYQRQSLIREIQHGSGRNLICYISGPHASIDRDDTVFL
jgi:hypothetical protein